MLKKIATAVVVLLVIVLVMQIVLLDRVVRVESNYNNIINRIGNLENRINSVQGGVRSEVNLLLNSLKEQNERIKSVKLQAKRAMGQEVNVNCEITLNKIGENETAYLLLHELNTPDWEKILLNHSSEEMAMMVTERTPCWTFQDINR